MDAKKCRCGAITVEINDNSYSMTSETFDKRFPDHYSGDVEEVWYDCNHCINHWGIDLCGCGSGEPFEECEEDNEGCNIPAQSIEDEVVGCSCKGGW